MQVRRKPSRRGDSVLTLEALKGESNNTAAVSLIGVGTL